MRRIFVILSLCIVGGVLMTGSAAMADYLFWEEYADYAYNNNAPANEGWYKFNDTFDGTQMYNDYTAGALTEFKIITSGAEYYAGDIDTFLSFDSLLREENAVHLANWDHTGRSGDFIMVFDLLADQYTVYFDNTSYSSDIDNWDPNPTAGATLDMADFMGKDAFWLGYGCQSFTKHWTKGKGKHTDCPPPPPPGDVIPEPATMFLFGTGLIGIAGLGRRKFFKKKNN